MRRNNINFGFETPDVPVSPVVQGFDGEPGFEGPQVVLTWDPIDILLISKITLVRKIGSYPLNENDGLEIFSQTSGFLTKFVDTNVIPGVDFYYTIFAHDMSGNVSLFDQTCMVDVIPLDSQFFKGYLIDHLPSFYKQADRGNV